MKIGICSTDFKPSTIDGLFQKMSGYGFTATQFSWVSIGMEEIPAHIGEDIIEALKAASAKYGVEIVAMNGTFNFVDPDPDKLRENLRRLPGLMEACRKLDCNILTICTGTRGTGSMWAWHKDNRLPESWELLKKSMKQVLPACEKYGVTMAMETEVGNVVDTPQNARRLMDEMHSKYIRMILDCANIFPKGTCQPENVDATILNAFACFGNDIVLAHGKDIAQSPDDIVFAATGEGIINYDLYLDELKKYRYAGAMVLHGIYDESKMRKCHDFMADKLAKHGL